ncbi:MAG: hypothetical protein IPH06_12415 [Alphaproteobacteria bacterium]|nr:hypothetical protein [Alphaproteobacteria bacterium]QQS56272.1 MAG: hypothetical protein IPN28_08170 [Alphaproteobacteria bacterium]
MTTGRSSGVTKDPYLLSSVFLQKSRVDDAGGGYCAKGVANLLEHVGLGCQRGDAYTWKSSLPQNGWIKLEGVRPEDAPPGSVLLYDRSANSRGKGGGTEFGHVEIATVDVNGRRQYVSDKARDNWGGTVPQNFVGVYVHPSLHKTMDGIHYTPNLDARNSTMLASSQARQGQNGRTDQNGATNDLAFMNLINGTGNTGTDQSAGGETSSNFNDQAKVAAFVVLAAMISQMFGINMDTGQPRGPAQSDPQYELTQLGVQRSPPSFGVGTSGAGT